MFPMKTPPISSKLMSRNKQVECRIDLFMTSAAVCRKDLMMMSPVGQNIKPRQQNVFPVEMKIGF